MATIMPESEQSRKAVKWIDEQHRERPETRLDVLIEEACQRFNLGPKDAEFLQRFFTEQGSGNG